MKQQDINLPIFLNALSWGCLGCHSDSEVQYARTSLTVSDELPGILWHWYNPLRGVNLKKGKRPSGAWCSLWAFAIECVGDLIDRKMKISAPLFLSPPEELSEDHLTKTDFEQLKHETKCDAPVLWQLLQCTAYSKKQELQNKHKDQDMVSATIFT